MYYDEDFYREPSEFEEQIEEFKENISKAVKSEFLEEMERLRTENRKLQGIKNNFEQVKADYEKKKRECDRAMQEAETKAKHMKIAELMEKYKTFLWKPDWAYLYGRKCEKCDDGREIEITLPSGRKVKDSCDCSRNKRKVMFPSAVVRYELADRDRGVAAWYRACGNEKDGRYYTLDYASSIYADRGTVKPGTSFEILEEKENKGNILFSTKDECQAYCDYLNEKDAVPSGVIYERNGSIRQDESEFWKETGYGKDKRVCVKQKTVSAD